VARPAVPDSQQRDLYWDVVRRSVEQVFQGAPDGVSARRVVFDGATEADREKFYQAAPYSVAADIAGETGAGTPSQQLEYLRIRQETGYGGDVELPPHLWNAAPGTPSRVRI
jgi:hypothetical protein